MVYQPKNRKKYTIADIANELGVSKTTVSRALNNKSDILPETRERILETVKKYNYQPSAMAKGMSIRKNNTIGVFIPHDIDYVFMNPFYEEIIRGIFKEADTLGYYILLLYCRSDNYLDVIYQNRVDGLLVISPGLNHRDIIDKIEETGIPYVLTSRMPGVTNVPHVCVDNYKGALIATEHLIDLGHKKICFINGPDILSSSADRLRGYMDALKKNGIRIDQSLITEGANNIDSGYLITKKLVKTVKPTAFFVAGDFMAFGVMNAIQEMGLKIPEDISVVGFDDIPMAKVMNPPLTTINQSTLKKGRTGVSRLVEIINGNKDSLSTELDVELVVRKTTGKVSD